MWLVPGMMTTVRDIRWHSNHSVCLVPRKSAFVLTFAAVLFLPVISLPTIGTRFRMPFPVTLVPSLPIG